MNAILQDLRYGARMLVKNPSFTLIAILTLALGIGANSAIFSVVSGVLLKELPFAEPERLLLIWNRGAQAAGGDRTPLAVADLLDLRAQNRSFDGIGAFRHTFFTYTGGETPERVRGAAVTADFFTLLGVRPALGRDFLPDEERAGAGGVVILSDGFWRRRFASDPGVIGRAINLSGASYTIIGIAPAGLNFPVKEAELWTALQLQQPVRRGPFFLTGVARLKPGATIEEARAGTAAMKASLSDDKFDFNLLPVEEFIVGDVRTALVALLVAVTFVLLIAAANVANLTLVRAASRAREISIRTALGASRSRIIRQLLTESLLLALVGGTLGTLIAAWGVELLVKLAPEGIPRLEQIRVDASVLGWTALVSLVTGVFFGLQPAWQISRPNLAETLKEGGRSADDAGSRRRWRNLLVVAELSLAVMLLAGAGLLVKSLWQLNQVDPGVDTERVLTVRLMLVGERYSRSEQLTAFHERLLERVEALPGVRTAAFSNSLPPGSPDFSDDFTIEGRPVAPDQTPPIAYVVLVSPDYFSALGISLRRGRLFSRSDTPDSPPVMLINETLARRFFPGEDPIGKRINMVNMGEPVWNEIVGIVSDAKYNGLADEVQPAIYQPLSRVPSRGTILVIKGETDDVSGLISAVRREVGEIDRELPLSQISTLDEQMYAATAQPRFRTTLIALFAALAVALACVGIYGVISYSVTQRTREIGVRLALGAERGDIVRLVMREGMVLAGAGVAIGLAGALGLMRLIESLLFGVNATDPLTFAATALLLLGVALAACYLPARRAMRVDPMIALRYE